jgi:hypothetical protein
VPFRVFSRVVDRRALPPRRPPLGIRVSFRVFGLPKYRPYWFCDPTLPFGLPPAVWFSLGRLPQPQLSDRCILSSSSAFLQSLDQRDLVRQPQPANTSHGLCFPSAHQATAVHLPRALPRPVTFRLQGLATLLAAFSRRLRAGFFSHRQRSWDSPFGAFPSDKVSGAFPPERTHLPFCAAVVPAAEAVSRPGRPRFLGFIPCRSPWRQQQVLVALPLGAPVGFALPGLTREGLDQDFARSPLSRFFRPRPKA